MRPGPQFNSLFHGTYHPLEGDTLLPSKRRGAGNAHTMRGQDANTLVSASTNEDRAWYMGHLAASDNARVQVHELEPHPQQRVGIENKLHPDWSPNSGRLDNDEVVAPSFKVKTTHDIKPGHQGTFPGVDWSAHLADIGHKWTDEEYLHGHTDPSELANHPSPERVAQEMAGEHSAEAILKRRDLLREHGSLDPDNHPRPSAPSENPDQLSLPFHENVAQRAVLAQPST